MNGVVLRGELERKDPKLTYVYVIGADRGFAKFGYAVFQLTPEGEKVVEVEVIKTQKDAKKQHTLAASDNDRRTREIYVALSKVVKGGLIVAAASEASSLPRNASTAYKLGRADGAWTSILTQYNIPLAEASPQAIKKKVCGDKSAPKVAVQAALEDRYPGQFDEFRTKYPKGMWEHGFDAAASIVACLDSDIFIMARQLIRGE